LAPLAEDKDKDTNMPRKTMRMSEIRALANRYLAGSDPELVEFREGVANMYESLAMAANDYHGYNDLVQIWAGEPGDSAYVPDETHRRAYHGEMSGPDKEAAEDFIRRYREARDTDAELVRRQHEARNIQLDAVAREIAGSIADSARLSGDDPIAWVTGNRYMPPLRSFPAAEAVWQDDTDGQDFDYLTELVEAKLSEAGVALECPEHDNALYAVDLRRFEYSEDPEGDTLQADWRPIRSDAEIERDRRAAAGDDQAQDAQHEADQIAAGLVSDETRRVVSDETLRNVAHVGHHWPDGVHTREELEQLEPGRRGADFLSTPCPCGCEAGQGCCKDCEGSDA
jgi:hypothetical protein